MKYSSSGDLASLKHADGKLLPGVAPVAMQQGRYVARQIAADLAGNPRKNFHYVDKGSLATIGRAAAVAQFGKVHISGFIAWLSWLFIHIFFLIGFRNRVVVMFQWAWSYLTYARWATADHRRVARDRCALDGICRAGCSARGRCASEASGSPTEWDRNAEVGKCPQSGRRDDRTPSSEGEMAPQNGISHAGTESSQPDTLPQSGIIDPQSRVESLSSALPVAPWAVPPHRLRRKFLPTANRVAALVRSSSPVT